MHSGAGEVEEIKGVGMYRHEDWKPNVIAHNKLASMGITFPYKKDLEQSIELVEAGADAMLKELRKHAVTLRIADKDIDVPGFDIVFIPEEQ